MNRNALGFGLSVVVSIVFLNCAHQSEEAPPVTDQTNFTQQVPIPPNSRVLEINHHSGNIKVVGWGEDYILMEGVKRAMADTAEEAQGMVEFIGIRAYEKAPDRLVLEYAGPTNLLSFGRSNTGVDATISVPSNMPVDIENKYGDVQVENMDANVSIDHRDGDVYVDGIRGRLQIRSQGRNVIVKNAARTVQMDVKDANINVDNVDESLSIKHSNGEVQIANVDENLILNCKDSRITAENIRGRIEVDNRKGDVFLKRFFDGVQATVEDGTLNLRPMIPVAQSYYCSVDTGDLILRVPEGSNMLVEMTAVQGRIHSDFNLPIRADSNTSSAKGAVGNGQYEVRLNVKRGSASLFKSSEALLQAENAPSQETPAKTGDDGLTPASIE